MAFSLLAFTAYLALTVSADEPSSAHRDEPTPNIISGSKEPHVYFSLAISRDEFFTVDFDKDGKVSHQDAKKAGLTEEVFQAMDKNRDGYVDFNEWQDAAQRPGVGVNTQFQPGSPWAHIGAKEFAVLLAAPVILYACFSQNLGRFAVVFCWLVSSFGMNVMNKLAASHFPSTCLLVIIQMVFADFVMILEWKNMTYEKLSDVIKWMIVPLFFAGMLSTSIWAFKETTMSTVLILRNVLPLFAFAVEKYLFNNPATVTASLILSMFVAFAGTVLYGFTNISVTKFSAFIILANCVITVADRVLQRYFLASKDFTVSVPLCMAINNVVGVVPMFILAICLGEVPKWSETVLMASPRTWVWVVMSGLFGTCLGYLGLKCQKLVSATTFLMLQNFNKIALIVFGMMSMGDKMYGIPMAGCLVSMLGTLWYGYERLPAERNEIEKLCDKMTKAGSSKAEPMALSAKTMKDYGTQAGDKKESV
eukprot:gnl/TRDRNA2_/TRDRNA2_182475_c0_seq1.p1 gnl/TRDRNA2_/TRDRNA2_182475_c0~~gnl/TRDRNA2_/TRDRNA2_182475_c0_seq1.p1  ORF type:complete len:478 (+),score=78.77 gnl/TRDRNA2_/TRDRNA2_182475_c0_seq1:59-1492(+)